MGFATSLLCATVAIGQVGNFDALSDELIYKFVSVKLRHALRSWVALDEPPVYRWGKYGSEIDVGVFLRHLPSKRVGNGFAGNASLGRGVVLGVNVVNIGPG